MCKICNRRRRTLERNIKLTIFLAASACFIGMIVVYITKYSTFKLTIQPNLVAHNEAVDQFLPDFEADRIAAADSFLSMPRLTGGNAGPDLNGKIPWTPERPSTELCELNIPEEMRRRLRDAGDHWHRLGPEVFATLDFAWLTRSLSYNHWSVWDSPPIKNHFSDAKNTSLDMPMPDYEQLLMWSKLRYLHGLHNNDLLAAQSEIRHLAELIETHELMVATKTALSIFALESEVAQTEAAKTTEFVPISEDLLKRVSSMLTYFESAAHPFTRDDLVRKITAYHEPHFGLCGIVASFTWIRSVDIFRPIQFKDTNKLLDSFAKSTNCRREYQDFLYQAPQAASFLGAHPFFSQMARHKFSYFLFKDTIGLIIDKSSLTDGVVVYRKNRKHAG